MQQSTSHRTRYSIRLKAYDYSQPGGYFVTICTHERNCMFGDIVDGEMITNQYGTIVEECWNNIPHHFTNVELDAFVVMPNHFHGIICLMEPVGAIHESPLPTTPQQRRNMLLSKIIGRFKMMSAKEINILRNTMGTHIWQRNYYEHIIRSNKELQTIRTYIINNPAQWALDTEYNVIHTNTQL